MNAAVKVVEDIFASRITYLNGFIKLLHILDVSVSDVNLLGTVH